MRIAVIGPGMMGLEHAIRIRRSADLELAGIVHPDTSRRFPSDFDEIPISSSIDALSRRVNIDGVIIATPNRQHVSDIRQCAMLGLPMLVEKPMADTFAGAVAAVQAIEARRIPTIIGYHRLYSPVIEKAAAIVASGELGELVCVRGCAKYLKPQAYFIQRPWRATGGGGPLKINFVHDIASMIHVLGRVAEVQAIASSRVRGSEVEDTAVASLVFEDGILGSFVISDCVASCESWEASTGDNPRFPHYAMENCYEISGTRGSLKVPGLEMIKADLETPSWERPFERSMIAWIAADPWARQLAHFAEVVAGTASPRVTPRFGLHVAAVMSAIDRSIATGARVRVPATPMESVDRHPRDGALF